MSERAFSHVAPRITFTNDFHELLYGDLRPGAELVVRYDPKRIVPDGEPYRFGDPNSPIVAHAAFCAGEAPTSKTLVSPNGVQDHPYVESTGRGSMLQASFLIPESAGEVVLWFSYASPRSGMHYDSDEGRNFRFGFVAEQIKLLSTDVVSDPQTPYSGFSVRVAAVSAVERVSVRFRVVGDPQFGKQDLDLGKTGDTEPLGWPIWQLSSVAVPYRAVIHFKLFYWIAGTRYKDDNHNQYYLAPQPAAEKTPPPPQELADAANAWTM
ncbi:MAG: hypothetical protein IPM60_03660 [Rhodospirillales bacterium]|nr:hypothetical protein [Rhodospirillales bacterium]